MNGISKEEARNILIHSQGFDGEKRAKKGGPGPINKEIRRLGYVQIDTLSVVVRAHHHVLWSRNHKYKESDLVRLVAERKVFEYWSHAAAYLPIEDFRFTLPKKKSYLDGHHHWFEKNKKVMKYVLDRIRAEGPMQSKDFETDRKRGSWFDWKPAKIALEQLFMEGSLMISERNNFQKVYDLTERVVPSGINKSYPSEEEYARYLIKSTLNSIGIATLKDFIHLRTSWAACVKKELKRLTEEKEIIPVRIAGISDEWYCTKQSLKLKKTSSSGSIHILSPFDNMIIRRERISKLFDWNYTLECYVPESKRKYGYFSLPLLYEGKFAGTVDAKADRKAGLLILKTMHIDRSAETEDFITAFAVGAMKFGAFNQCSKVKCGAGIRRNLSAKINSALKNAV